MNIKKPETLHINNRIKNIKMTLGSRRSDCNQFLSRAVRSFINKKSTMVRKSCRSIIFAVGKARHRSSSSGPKLLTMQGRCLPGNSELRQEFSFSPVPLRLRQSGGDSNKLTKEAISDRILRGIKNFTRASADALLVNHVSSPKVDK